MANQLTVLTWQQVLGRALRLRCPCCGRGKLFASYLKVVEKCSVCREEYGHIRADDGPTWITVLLTGHLIVPLLLYVQSHTDWPTLYVLPAFMVLTTLVVFALLPPAKAGFVSVIWFLKRTGAQ